MEAVMTLRLTELGQERGNVPQLPAPWKTGRQ